MVLIFFIGGNQDEKNAVAAQLGKTFKKVNVLPEHYDRKNATDHWKTIQFWEKQIEHQYHEIQSLKDNEFDKDKKKNVSVVIMSIIDILVDAYFHLSKEELERLTKATPKVDQLIKACQSSVVCIMNHQNFGVQDSHSHSPDKSSRYNILIQLYALPIISLSNNNDSNKNDLTSVIRQYKFPFDTFRYRQKKLKVKSTANFLFMKPRRSDDDRIYVRSINITEESYTNSWIIFPVGHTNRFINQYPYSGEKLIQLYFHVNVRSEIVHNILLNGVTINGNKHTFLGCSSEGLKFRKCYMWQGTEEEVNLIIKENGNFDRNVVSKRMARFGLLFSEVVMTNIEIKQNQIIHVDDIVSECKRYNFTDGCGAISVELARLVMNEIRKSENVESDTKTPSVFKIRLQGYKGVLALDKNISGEKIQVRPSMEKFKTSSYPFLAICEHSEPFTFGHLNRQYIQLLSGLGVSDATFTNLQRAHLELVEQMCFKVESALSVLRWQKQTELVRAITEAGTMDQLPEKNEILHKIKKVQASIVVKSEKLRILVPESRYIFGVCDPYGILKYGECYLRITTSSDGVEKNIRGSVVICKTPCYLLGDVRVLTAISEIDSADVSKLNHLVDCIVFPIRGHRPHPNEIAGSDLDGDKFFVSWNPDLIPTKICEPYDYPAAQSKPEGDVTMEKMIAYFSNQNKAQKLTNEVARYFKYWCDREGIHSEKCEQLGMLFSRVIDSAKTGAPTKIPIGLRPLSSGNASDIAYNAKYIWQQLECQANEFVVRYKKEFTKLITDCFKLNGGFAERGKYVMDITSAFLIDFLKEQQSTLTEFEKFQLAWNHSEFNKDGDQETIDFFMNEYAQYIEFSNFSIDHKQKALEIGIPLAVMTNALYKSQLLTHDDLLWFTMHTPRTPWRFYLRKDYELNWMYFIKALTNSDNTCLIIELPGKVLICLLFHYKLEMGLQQAIAPGSVSSLFFSKNFGYKHRHTIGADYYLDLTEDILQIYRNKERGQTFVWFKATDFKMNRGFLECDEGRNTLSVDLSRFNRNIFRGAKPHPLLNKTLLSRVEIFVLNDSTENVLNFDIIESRGDFPFEEQIATESAEGDYQNDCESLLLQPPSVFPADISVVDFQMKLEQSAMRCNIVDFKNLTSKLDKEPNENKNLIVDALFLLLENIIRKTAPFEISERLRTSLQFIVSVEQHVTDPIKRLCFAELLSRTNLRDICLHFLTTDLFAGTITTRGFLDVLQNWPLLWHLDTNDATKFIDSFTQIALHNAPSRSSDEAKGWQERYIIHYGRLHCLGLVQDMNKLKDQLRQHRKNFSTPTGVLNLKIDRTTEGVKGVISLYRSSALSCIPKIYEGQFVCVCRQYDLNVNPSFRSAAFIAKVQQVTPAPFFVELKVLGVVPDIVQQTLESNHVRFWRIDVISNIVTYQRIMIALQIMQKDILFNFRVPLLPLLAFPGLHNKNFLLFDGSVDIETISSMLRKSAITCSSAKTANTSQYLGENEKQKLAIDTALMEPVTCIEGPPGTGKTTVACRIIDELIRMKKYKKMLVVAETNNAVNNVARKLRDKCFIVRLGATNNIPSDLYDVSLEGQVDKKAQMEVVSSRILDDQGNICRNTELYKEVLDKANVILTTCAGVGDVLLDNYSFKFVLVDEASYTMETTLLCSLVRGCKHLVMIGDSFQLSPFISQSQKEQDSGKGLPKVHVLCNTFFQRLQDCEVIPRISLDKQYRMHPELLRFPSQAFYGDRLVSDQTVYNLPNVVFPWPNKSRPVCFIDAHGTEELVGSSFKNEKEAKIVSDVVDKLLNVKEDIANECNADLLLEKQITVLTFYQGQVTCLKDTLNARVAVGTVDGYQGCENEVIVASTVRSNKCGTLGFSDDRSRLNVLFTRTRRALIVVGNKETLCHSNVWGEWLSQVDLLNADDVVVKKEKKKTFVKPYEKPYTKSVNPRKSRQQRR